MSDSPDIIPHGSLRQLIHDMNGQLFVVRGSAELIEMTTPDAATREKAKRMLEACDRLADVAQQMHKVIREKNL